MFHRVSRRVTESFSSFANKALGTLSIRSPSPPSFGLVTARKRSKIHVVPRCDRATSGSLKIFPLSQYFPTLKRNIVKSVHEDSDLAYAQNDPTVETVSPQIYTQALDLKNAYVGQVFEAPYEVTLTEGHRALHLSTFFEYDRICSSRPFAMRCGLPDAPLPFTLVLSHCNVLNHVDSTRDVLDIGFENACYIQPVFPGDTVRKMTTIRGIRATKDEKNTIVTLRNELFNQAKQLVMQVDKTMLYVGTSYKYDERSNAPPTLSRPPESLLLKTITEHAAALTFPHTRPLFEGQCLLHHMSVPLGVSRHLSLLASVRQAHPRLVNFARYSPDEIVVPGVIVAGMAHAAASRSLFEILYERVDKCVFVNRVSPLDSISAVTYIASTCDFTRSMLVPHSAGASGLCEVKAITIGIKNLDSVRSLADKVLPKKLFNVDLKPSEIETLVAEKVPILSGRIAVISARTLVRQSYYSRAEQIPLL